MENIKKDTLFYSRLFWLHLLKVSGHCVFKYFFFLFLGHSVTQPITHGMSATDLHQMETLKAENERLRFQLSDYTKKISRVASLEQEMAKIHQAYQSLLKHSEKRELLEKSARAKLQSVIINLSDANKVITISKL